jgi:hypothetical protein
MTPAGAGLLLGALACVTGALVITFTTSSARHADGYTALWLLPPTQGNAREGGARIGVGSEEQERSSYRLRVRVGDRPAEIVREFRLEPGETRVLKVNPMLPLDSAAPPVPVRAKLFLQSAPEDVYRRVSGWLAEPGRSP